MFILAGVTPECSKIQPVLAIIKLVINIIRWVVPVVLILLGTIDLVKAVSAGKEEDIKKNQNTLIKRAIAAVIVFLIPILVNAIMGLIGNDGEWKTCYQNANTFDLNGN